MYYAHARKNKYTASPPLCSERNGMATPHIAQDTYGEQEGEEHAGGALHDELLPL